MKKIDWSKPIWGGDGIEYDREDIEIFFRSAVEPSIRTNLESLKTELTRPDSPGDIFVDHIVNLLDELPNILLANPQKLHDITVTFDQDIVSFTEAGKTKSQIDDFLKKLLDAFDYSGFRKRFLNQLAIMLNVKTCLYCNQQYTLAVGNSIDTDASSFLKNSTAFLQFDHFFCKKQYPTLSMSLYNLIPCCPICNQKKSKRRFSLALHPYENDLSSMISFRIKDLSAFTNPINRRYDLLEVEIDTFGNEEVTDFVNQLALDKRYARHLDVVEDIDAALYMEPYYRRFLKEIIPSDQGKREPAFENQKALNRHMDGFYSSPDDINIRPLTKFCQDIRSQLSNWHNGISSTCK